MSEFEQENEEQLKNIKEVPAIKNSRAEMISSKEKIAELVEEPVRLACEILYDKNIKTLESTANSGNLEYGHEAIVVIDYNSLSEENRKIAESMGLTPAPYDNTQSIALRLPIDENSTVGDISNRMNELANRFLKQEPTWIPRYNIKQLRKIYGIGEDEEKYTPAYFKSWYYDQDSGEFFYSEEHFNKVKEFRK